MRSNLPAMLLLLSLALALSAQAALPTFKTQEIDHTLKIGYAVTLADINGDGKKDIVVTDKDRIIWFENPTWKLHTIIQGHTTLDNVSLDAYDIDGDGQLDLVLGAGWKPGNSKDASTLQWLRRGKTLDEPWQIFPIEYNEPLLHRIRFADINNDGKKQLIVTPLQGKGSTGGKNWSETPTRVLAYKIPVDPTQPNWPADLITDSFHVMHNFQAVDFDGDGKLDLITASYEGVSLLRRDSAGKWIASLIGEGDQSKPTGSRGSSELKLGKLKNGHRYIATIEPWHGFQVVVYTEPPAGQTLWTRHMIDNQLQWGHAVWCADLDGDGDEELIIGVRDPLAGKAKSGIRIYKATDAVGAQWEKQEIDPGGVAVEDATAGDLDGDGKIDIVAVGRATQNVRIYWNQR